MSRFLKILKNLFLIKNALKKSASLKDAGSKINEVLEDLGPTFIKMGQMLSMRSDLIPAELADEFRKLLDAGHEISTNILKQKFSEEFKTGIDNVFNFFETKPLAVASLSQVHKATHEGKTVVVKFQKPNIEDIINQDLKIVRNILKLSKIFSFNKKIKEYHNLAESISEEFFRWINRELDYRLEAINISRIGNNFKDVGYFQVPEVIYKFSSKKILTMTFLEGISLNEIFNKVPDIVHSEKIECQNISFSKKEFINNMVEVIMKQIFEDGYFHADPHPGNIIITKNNKIAYIDFGVVGTLSPKMRDSIANVMKSVVDRDITGAASALVALDEVEGNQSMESIEIKIRKLLEDWQSGSVIEMTMAEVFFRLLLLAKDSGIDAPLSVIVIGKTILEYDGVLRKFDPELDIIKTVQEYAANKNLPGWLSQISKQLPEPVGEWAQKGLNLPNELKNFIGKIIDEGIDVSVHFGHHDHKLANKK